MCKIVLIEMDVSLAEEAVACLESLQTSSYGDDNIPNPLIIIKDKIQEALQDA